MQYSLMATVRLPMAAWSSKGAKAQIESLKWKEESLRQQKQVLINEATGAMQTLLASIVHAKKQQVQLSLNKTSCPPFKKNYQVLQLGYEQNTGELFELLDAWQTLNMTQLEYWQQVQDLLTLQTEMDKTLQQK